MAGIIKRMSTIKQLLRLHNQGVSNRKIAEALGKYKGTLNYYINTFQTLGHSLKALGAGLGRDVQCGVSSVAPGEV